MEVDDDLRVKLWKTLIIIIMCLVFWGLSVYAKPSKETKLEETIVSAIPSPIFIKGQVLGNNLDTYNIQELSFKIIYCESGWNQYAKNDNSTAYGLGQFTDGTWEYVQIKWGIKLDRYNYDDQLYAFSRLLKEEGTSHWEESEKCWATL